MAAAATVLCRPRSTLQIGRTSCMLAASDTWRPHATPSQALPHTAATALGDKTHHTTTIPQEGFPNLLLPIHIRNIHKVRWDQRVVCCCRRLSACVVSRAWACASPPHENRTQRVRGARATRATRATRPTTGCPGPVAACCSMPAPPGCCRSASTAATRACTTGRGAMCRR